MNSLIKNALLNGRLVILLGAGASVSAKNFKGECIPTGFGISKILAEKIGIELEDGDDLSDIYATAKKELGTHQLNQVFEEYFKNCTPSEEYRELVSFPLPRIYTFNIDDSLEKAAALQSRFKFNVRRRNSSIIDFDMYYSQIDLIKLNGDINFPEDGYIFSPSEYGEGSAFEPNWYTELARDYHRFTFLFIGTKLKEPLFQHQIEKYKARTGEQNIKSYLLVPNLSLAQQGKFKDSNIEYISGTLLDFITWLRQEFREPLNGSDILAVTRPELNIQGNNIEKKKVFDDITVVNRAVLSLIEKDESVIKSFYKGFKPTWNDILDNIPAMLANTKYFLEDICSNDNSDCQLFLILGSAGSGKTTALKQIGLALSEISENNVYYIDGYNRNLSDLISALDRNNSKTYYLIIDRIAEVASDIAEIIKSKMSIKVKFIVAENPRIWNYRGKEHFNEVGLVNKDFSNIQSVDVDQILDKIEKYGHWTRLKKMSLKNRRIEINKKSKSQLLIGLMEATSGEGYPDIIRKEFDSINDDSQKALLLLSGLAGMQRSEASEATLVRALSYLNLNPNVYGLAKQMEGLMTYRNGMVNTRHRLYIEKLIDNFIDSSFLKDIVESYIFSFSVYQFPIVRNINVREAAIYKGLVNFKFLSKIFKDNQDDIVYIYEKFEKILESEGLFLLQYGLALRAYNMHGPALEKFIQARQAFPESAHIDHAYAQQLLILAYDLDDQTLAESYLSKASETLRSIDKYNKKEGDRYPIVSLSEGHVKILNKFGNDKLGRTIAKSYYDEINRKFGADHTIQRVKSTQEFLLRYYSTGSIKDKTLNYN